MELLDHCSFRYIVRKQSNSQSETVAFLLILHHFTELAHQQFHPNQEKTQVIEYSVRPNLNRPTFDRSGKMR
jgi:hypothetical protein